MVEGTLEGRRLTCSAHSWEFDVVTGRGVNPDDCALQRYAVKVEDENVLVDVRAVIAAPSGSQSS